MLRRQRRGEPRRWAFRGFHTALPVDSRVELRGDERVIARTQRRQQRRRAPWSIVAAFTCRARGEPQTGQPRQRRKRQRTRGPTRWQCPTVIFCEAVASNSSGNEVAFGSYKTGKNKLGWYATTVTGATVPASLSCPSTSLCLGLAWNGQLQASSDPDVASGTWSNVNPYPGGGSSTLQDASCPTATFCVAVSANQASVTRRTRPTRRAATTEKLAPAQGRSTASRCPSSTLCVAVDAGGNVVTSTDPEVAGDWHSTRRRQRLADRHHVPFDDLPWPWTTDGHVLTSTNPTGGSSAWSVDRRRRD